jgi:type II secretory pathway component PulL
MRSLFFIFLVVSAQNVLSQESPSELFFDCVGDTGTVTMDMNMQSGEGTLCLTMPATNFDKCDSARSKLQGNKLVVKALRSTLYLDRVTLELTVPDDIMQCKIVDKTKDRAF